MLKANFLVLLLLPILLAFSHQSKASTSQVELYAELPHISKMAISPDASKFAFRLNKDGNDMLVVRNKADSSLVGAVRIDGINPNSLYFVNDNTVILVATQNIRLAGYWGRHDASWAYAYNIEENKVFPLLTQGYGIFKGQTQLGRIVGISPDKKHVYMPAYQNEGRYSLYKVRLDKKRKPKRVLKGGAGTRDYFMNTKGEVIARERLDNKKNLHIIDARVDDEWVEVYREETEIPTKGFSGVTPDQQHLLFSSVSGKTNRHAYYKMSLKDGSVEGPIFSAENKDVESVLTNLNRIVYGVSYSGFTPSYEFFDDKLNARMRGMAKALPDNYVGIQDYNADWSNIVFYIDGGASSGEYYLYQDGGLHYLASLRSQLAETPINPVTEYSFKTRDDYTIPTLLTTPAGIEAKNLPAIVMPHGGPEAYDTKSFDYMAQYFSSQGYLVIQPQFRGSAGFGWQHRELGRGQWGRMMQDDLTDALASLVDQGVVNKEKVCIVGASYGGYAALAGAAFTPDLYKCAVSINGVSDIERMMRQEQRDHGKDHWVVSYWNRVIKNGDVEDNFLEKISPINYVKQVKAPVLLIHGARDEVVPFDQSEEFFDEMEDANKVVKLVELKKGNHYLSKAENRMKAMKAIDAFLKQYLN